MNDGFTRKKVESLTLGEKLKKLRGDFRMSLSEISKSTKIQVKYLEYLENGEYDKLPADVYVRGFLKSYAQYFNIDESTFIKLYERERHIQKNLHQQPKVHTLPRKKIHISSLVVTPQSLVIAVVVLFVFGAFFYVFQEFQTFALVPRLIILSPTNGSVVDQDTILVQGKTDKGSRVSINDQIVFVDTEGNFSSTLPLQFGVNTMKIVAVDRFEKQKTEILSVESSLAPPSTELLDLSSEADQETFHIEISVQKTPTRVTITKDGEIIFDDILALDVVQNITAKNQVTILSDNPSETFVRWNDNEKEPLSKEKKLKNPIIFTKTGRQP